MSDEINPKHYRDLDPKPIDVIEAWDLGFRLGNAVKYIARAGRKGDRLTDLQKAEWYLQREIRRARIGLARSSEVDPAPCETQGCANFRKSGKEHCHVCLAEGLVR